MAVSLKVEERATRPRSIRNKLRHEGKVPAVVNGYKIESTPISIDEREFSKLLRENGANTVGVLTQTLYTATVSATPEKLPEGIDVDISGLEIGQSISVGDLPKNDDYTIVTDAEEQIVAVQEAQELPEEDEAAEGAEPEVIGESTEE